MADPEVLRVLGVFSGIGGLELAVHRGAERVGLQARCVGMVERETFSAACLVEAMARGDLAPCPVWLGDVRALPAEELHGCVDLVCGGFPCQDISSAGKGVGLDGGERSVLFYDLLAIADRVGSRYLFLENVAAITLPERGLDAVLGALAEGGWDAEWLCLEAADVGAPHGRDRWFLLGHRENGLPRAGWTGSSDGGDEPAPVADPLRLGHDGRAPDARRGPGGGSVAPGAGEELADALRSPSGQRAERERVREDGGAVADGDEGGRLGAGACVVADRPRSGGSELGCFPPGPADLAAWDRVLSRDLSRAPSLPKSALRGVPDGLRDRLDEAMRYRGHRLRGLGNAVVPEQGAAAFAELWRRLR